MNRLTSDFAYGAIALLWIVTARTALPQDTGDVVLRADSRAVQLSAVVEDTNGKPVRGLGKEDFAIIDEGKPRQIKIFDEIQGLSGIPAPARPTPINGGFSSRLNLSPPPPGSTIIAIDTAAGALMGAVDTRRQTVKVCAADDYVVCEVSGATPASNFTKPVAIYAICPQLRLLQDFTSDRAQLLIALQSSASSSKQAAERCPAAQVLSAMKDIAGYMSASASRTSLLWLTAGFNNDVANPETEPALQSAIAALNDADAGVYAAIVSCAAGGSQSACQGSQQTVNSYTYSQSIQDFVQATGGGGLYIASATPAGGTALGAMLDLAQSGDPYRLGFYLDDADLDGRFHRIRVTLPARPKLVVNGRRGYTASPASVFAGDAGKELARKTEANALGIHANLKRTAESSLDIDLAVDTAAFPHSEDNTLPLDAIVTEFDRNGRPLAKFPEALQLRMSPGASTGSEARRVALAKDAEWLTILVHDNGSGRTGSLTIPLRQLAKADQ